MTTPYLRTIFVAAIAAVAASATLPARASTFTVGGTTNKFIVTRSGEGTNSAETVRYRTVGLSAYASQHFTSKSGTLTFAAGQTAITNFVTETSPSIAAYKFQTGSNRSYRFELTDEGGFPITNKVRTIATGTSVNSSSAFGSKNLTVNAGTITVTDGGYDQAYHSVTVNNYFNTAAPKDYLVAAGAQLRATVTFHAREKGDGYQYVAIYANTSTSNVDTGAKDGDPGTISYSRYMAGFTIDGNVSTTYYPYTFPLTSKGDSCGAQTHPWSGNSNGNLQQQYFKSGCRATDGRLVIPTDLSNLYIRFNASGNLNDTWYASNVVAHVQAVDSTQPTLYGGNVNAISVSPGPHRRGNEFYISIPFSEIVNSAGSKTLRTTWGSMDYHSGDGSNVITFKGTVNAADGTKLAITNCPCTFKDLKDNYFQGSPNKTFSGTTVSASYAYPISYDLAGGTLPSNAPTTYTYDALTMLVQPTRTGYTFDGWTGSNGSTPKKSAYIDAGSHGPRAYTAHWAVVIYTNSYDLAGGALPEESDNPETYAVTNAAYTLVNPVRTGYAFAGWTGTGIDEPTNEVTVAAGSTSNRSYVATWAANAYTVCFHANDGSGATHGQGFFYDEPQSLDLVSARTGYGFSGWTANADGTGDTYRDGQVVSNLTAEANGIVDLYALWVGNSYYIHFEGNATNAVGYTDQMGMTYDVAQNLNSNEFTRVGYDFAGWSTSTNGAVVYADREAVSNLTAEAGKTVTLYAQWDAHTYFVHFDANGGEGEMPDQSFTYDVVTNLDANAISRTGYDFVGWSTNENGVVVFADGQVVSNLTAEANGAVTLHAQWAVHTYTVHFDKNAENATGEMTDMAFNYDQSQTLSSNEFSRIGYDFVGWRTDENGVVYTDGQAVSNLTAEANGTVTLYAQWVAHTYAVHFNANGGTGTMPDQPFTYDVATNLDANAISRTGYDFVGWSTNENGTVVFADGQVVSNLTAEANGTVTLTAHWTPITYTVHFDANGGTGTAMEDMTFTYDAPQALTSNVFTRTGYIFAGWSYAGETFVDGATVSNLTGVAATVSLVAKWGVPYIDANGTEQLCADYTVITNTPEARVEYGKSGKTSWYVVNGAVAIDGKVTFLDDHAYLILCDGATLSVTNASGAAIQANGGLAIYGQPNGTGAIDAYGNRGISIHDNLTINGSNVTAAGRNGGGIYANSDLTINGGSVTAIGEKSVGIYANSNIVLGWRTHADSITASSYWSYSGTISVKAGQLLTDGTTIYQGAVDPAVLAGKTLRPYFAPYIDANGDGQVCTNYTALASSDGSVAYGDGWYVVSTNVTISGQLYFAGSAHLILCDGATLTVTNASGIAIQVDNNFTIYGQAGGTGAVVANCDYGIVVVGFGSVTINGGNVSATGRSYGICANGSVTINGGSVTATGGGYGICANGGTITLGWTNPDDSIYASSYYSPIGTVTVNCDLTDGNNTYSGSTGAASLAGKTLRAYLSWKQLQTRLDAGGTVTLINDVTATAGDATLTVTNAVTLDLNGHTLTHNGQGEVLSVRSSGDLTLTNSLAAGAVTGGGDHGVYVGSNAVFRLQGGAIAGNASNFAGGGVFVDQFGTFEMSGGSITNNVVQGGFDAGGGVYVVEDGTFTMTGGAISGNMAADGGGVFVDDGGAFTMTGGEISGNTADGGGVFVYGGTFTMTGGEISGNAAFNYGGGVFVYGGTFTMTGGEISGNAAFNYGGGVFVYGSTFTMTGGEISGNAADDGGGVYVYESNGTFMVSGSPVVSCNTNSVGAAKNVYLSSGRMIAVNGLSTGAFLGVTTDTTPTKATPVTFATGASAGDKAYFFSDKPAFAVDAANDELRLTKLPTPWDLLQAQLDAGGTVTLTNDVAAIDGDAKLTVTNAVTLDLNGHTLRHNGQGEVLSIRTGGDLTLTNSLSAGAVTGGGDHGVYVGSNAVFRLQGGAIAGNASNYAGGGVFVDRFGTFEMSGGSITNNAVSGGNNSGGGVYVVSDGAFTMTGGEISGNTAKYGGGVYVVREGTFSMTGGEISGNTASNNGGGVYMKGGTFTMTGGEISGNTASYGGGVYVSGGTFTVSGSPVVSDNTNSVGVADNVYLSSGRTIAVNGLSAGASIGVTTETTLTEPSPVTFATGASAGDKAYFFSDVSGFLVEGVNNELRLRPVRPWEQLQAQLYAGGTVTLTGDVTATNVDSPLFVTNAVTLDLNGHTITHNGNRQVLSVETGADLTLTNSLSAGTVTGGGDHGVYVGSNAVFRLQGGAIAGNESNYAGGGVFVDRFGTFEMSGGSITNNAVSGGNNSGGGVYVVRDGAFTMTGGEISSNSADDGGGVYVVRDGTFTMTGGEISGNTASRSGGGLYVSGGTFTMSGGGISDNTAYAGGGVYVDRSTVTVAGSPVIFGNTNSVGVANNVYLEFSDTIIVDGLSAGASIGVTTYTAPTLSAPVTFAIGASADDRTHFTSDNPIFAVDAADGELRLRKLKATPWDLLQARLDAGGTVTLTNDVIATAGDATLMVTNAVTLDLNGCTLDAAELFGVIQISAGGNLTLTNSAPESGVITGGYAFYGGVYVDDDGMFTMSGGEISGNAAYDGGGVYVYGGTFTMTGGEISGNTAEYGGGVYVYDSTFTMSGGEISGNAAYDGGGVYVYDGTFTMSGGEISGNTAEYGGGVYVYWSTVTVAGSPVISGNTNDVGAASNVHLEDGVIEVSNLTAGASIGVTTDTAPTESLPVTFATGASAGDEAYFFSDDSGCHVEQNGSSLLLAYGMGAIPYIDANGVMKRCTTYTVLTNAAGSVRYGTAGEEGWYVVARDIVIGGTLQFNGSTNHLIVCDGATLAVDDGIYTDGAFSIYGQPGGTGVLDLWEGIYVDHGDNRGVTLTINGGTVNATGVDAGICAGDVIVNAGNVTATGGDYGITTYNFGITINGGSVNASGDEYGMYAVGISLGWTRPSDSIYASSYGSILADYGLGTDFVFVNLGQTLIDENGNTYRSTVDDAAVLAGKTLRPYISPPNFKDPEGNAIEDPAVVGWLADNGFTQADINALGHDSAATDKLYACFLLNCDFTAQNAGGVLRLTGIAVSNGVVSVKVRLVRKAPLGAIHGVLNLYGATDLAAGFGRSPIAEESIEFGSGDPTFGTAPTAGTVVQSVTATFSVSDVAAKFFKAVIKVSDPNDP